MYWSGMGSNISRNRPSHSLDLAKSLAARGDATVNKRARDFIRNHVGRYDTTAYVKGLFNEISPEHFEKSVPLDVIPGVWGDVYRNVPYDGEHWYVKFAITEDGRLSLSVLSANWEGYIH